MAIINHLPREEQIAQTSRRAIDTFFEKTGISLDTWKPNGAREFVFQTVHDQVRKMNWGGIPPDVYLPHVEASINIATMAYGHTHPDVQVHVTIYTILLIAVDDLGVDARAMEEFPRRFYMGDRQLHPVLEHLVDNLRDMSRYFLPYAAAAIVAASLQYVSATAFDKQAEDESMTPETVQYIDYKRVKNGVAEAYGFMIWDRFDFPELTAHIQAIPEAIFFLNHVNDIFSFYKEELSGENCNFIHDRALVTGKDVPDVLLWLVDQVADAINRARNLLKGEKEKKYWEQFISGYAAFHYYSARYRLIELTESRHAGTRA